MQRDLRSRWARRGQDRFTFQPSAYDVADVIRGMAIEPGQVVVVTSNGGATCSVLDAWGNRQRVRVEALVPLKTTRPNGNGAPPNPHNRRIT